MEKYQRKAITTSLKEYCHLAKDGDFMEVAEWHNGEGFDLTINERIFQLTWGEFRALKKLAKKLYKE